MLAGIRRSGPVAPLVFDGAIDGEIYSAWAEPFLVPELHPGDVAIADNRSSHKNAVAREAIEAAGCRLLFLPPSSPDLNPIEEMRSKVKSILRDLAARELPALYDAIKTALSRVTPRDCSGFFRHAGYWNT